ncbi:MAG TPA: esterase [Blastocatellia bacterium]|nr:esterase [Blastocatellia bacterium]
MKYRILSIAAACLLAITGGQLSGVAARQVPAGQSRAFDLTLNIDGVERTALVYPNTMPESKTGVPLVLGFHGHGGRAEFVARRWSLHTLWPEAVVIYLQGLPTATSRDQDGSRPGWQIAPGGQNDRDVRFVDAVIEQARKQRKIDPDRIYAIGHSNGARFANVLWKTRGEKFAAFCSAAAQGGLMIRDATPRSIFAIAGENDRIVSYDGQVRSIEVYRRVLKTDSSKTVTKGYAKIEPGINGTELVTYLHPGGHEFPQDALPLVVEFFKRHSRK